LYKIRIDYQFSRFNANLCICYTLSNIASTGGNCINVSMQLHWSTNITCCSIQRFASWPNNSKAQVFSGNCFVNIASFATMLTWLGDENWSWVDKHRLIYVSDFRLSRGSVEWYEDVWVPCFRLEGDGKAPLFDPGSRIVQN